MRALLTERPLIAILAGYAIALAGAWWLVAEVVAGHWTPLAMLIAGSVCFFLGLRTGLAAQRAPEAADAADPMPEPVEAPRPAAIALGPAHQS